MKWTVRDKNDNVIETGLDLEEALRKYDSKKREYIFVPELDSKHLIFAS